MQQDTQAAIGFMRECAAELRRLAAFSAFMGPKFVAMADGLEEHARQLDGGRKGSAAHRAHLLAPSDGDPP